MVNGGGDGGDCVDVEEDAFLCGDSAADDNLLRVLVWVQFEFS